MNGIHYAFKPEKSTRNGSIIREAAMRFAMSVMTALASIWLK